VQEASARQGRAASETQGLRTLVIGCGFIGSRIVEELIAAGDSPAVLTRSRPPESLAPRLPEDDLLIGDAADPEILATALEGVGRVVFSAGGLLPVASELSPELDAELTLGPLLAVLEALRSRSQVSLTYLSSGGTVYGEPERIPVDEEAATSPLGVYGRLHLRCEDEVLRHRRDHGLSARILRCATVYGEGQRPERGQGAVVTFLHRAERGIAIDLYGGGTTIRDYVYVGDVARVVLDLLGRDDGPPILNVASGEGTSLIDLVGLVERQVGRAAEIAQHSERGFEVHRIVLDAGRLRRLVGFEPTPLAAGIARTHAWLASLDSERV
jgi:UDP-glucose 4-epimerase